MRLTKTNSGVSTRYTYDNGGRIILKEDGAQTATYIWGGDRLLIKKLASGAQYYYLYNGHGDVVQITDSAGNIVNSYEYDEWGNITSQTEGIENEFKYAGQTYDSETGLYYLRARYYDPTTGRFISKDNNEGSIVNPLSLNLYTYCENNPTKYVDPSGNSPWSSIQEFFHDATSDAKGRDILWHWLYGKGKELDFQNNKSWNKYMMENSLLKQQTGDLIEGYVSQVEIGQSMNFDITTAMEIENGEQMIGYQYLHGTNADVGGYKITGTITKDQYGNAAINFTYQWNDIIDPNFIYSTDSAKAKFAKGIPFANPTDYIIRISWSDISTLDVNGGFTSGWFYVPKPTPTPTPGNKR